VDTARRILILLGIAGLLGATANAISPRGLSWTRPLGRGVAAQAADAGMFPVELGSIKRLLRDRSVVFVDSRPRDEFDTGHLPGAVSLPWAEVEAGGVFTRPVLPRDRPLVIYCANEFCESALRLGMALKGDHANVAVFVDGYEAWWNAGGADEQK
jgi:rhodanese-related sulfurtransferase